MKFLFLVLALVAFVNANPRTKCMNECGVDLYMIRRVADYHDFQIENLKIKQFLLCLYKEENIIHGDHKLEDEIHRLNEMIKNKHEYHDVEVCKHVGGHTFEDLAWTLTKCMKYHRMSKHVTVSMACGDKLGISKKLVEEMYDHHRKISTVGDKKKEFYFCYFERFGWMDHDGKISTEAVKSTFKVTDHHREEYGGYIADCKKTCTTSWDIIKCFVDKIH